MKALTNFFDRIVQRFLPDAFLFAVILTLIVYVMGVIFTDSSPLQMISHWGGGFWDLLDFAMQMALIVTTGYILANTSIVRRMLTKISKLANTPAQAIILVTIVASIASIINYGFGLVVGALMAIYVARRVPSANFRLLVASAYSGFLLWHGGFSASAPLLVATEGHFLEDTMGTIPVMDTLFSSFNIFIIIVLLVTLPILNWLLLRTQDPLKQQNHYDWESNEYTEEEKSEGEQEDSPATRIENSQILSLLIGIMGMAYVVYHFVQNGFDLNLHIVIFIFLFLGIILHRTPRRFLNSVGG
ncbi:MAG TPA: TIGR00366 family protein, partial [Bacillota bacterium]|nr:TIGR00366 family protein [Bacillota bacterium]